MLAFSPVVYVHVIFAYSSVSSFTVSQFLLLSFTDIILSLPILFPMVCIYIMSTFSSAQSLSLYVYVLLPSNTLFPRSCMMFSVAPVGSVYMYKSLHPFISSPHTTFLPSHPYLTDSCPSTSIEPIHPQVSEPLLASPSPLPLSHFLCFHSFVLPINLFFSSPVIFPSSSSFSLLLFPFLLVFLF